MGNNSQKQITMITQTWVKTSTSLPEDDQPVFAILNDGRIFLAKTFYTNKHLHIDVGVMFYVYELGRYIESDLIDYWHSITAPNPPI